MTRPPAILLMGPTASGKTKLALFLREHLPVEIISVDAAQVYKGMDIGTAKPTPAEQAQAPHRLIDIRDPAQTYSAAEFCADALREMEAISRAGRIPLLVGGTMFYFFALEGGLSELPSADADVRARLTAEAAQTGWAALHARLCARDPDAAARINPNDAQRIQRALEIIELTGETPSDFAGRARPAPPPYEFVRVALIPRDRGWLHARIAQRFQAMLELGLMAEVEALYRRGDLSPSLPSVRTVGYRQGWDYLTGRITYNEMAQQAIAATRQLAKRQLTWLRRYEEKVARGAVVGREVHRANGSAAGESIQGRVTVFDSMEATENLCLTYLQRCLRPHPRQPGAERE
jgi:tRNA dimethylallyltransferase